MSKPTKRTRAEIDPAWRPRVPPELPAPLATEASATVARPECFICEKRLGGNFMVKLEQTFCLRCGGKVTGLIEAAIAALRRGELVAKSRRIYRGKR